MSSQEIKFESFASNIDGAEVVKQEQHVIEAQQKELQPQPDGNGHEQDELSKLTQSEVQPQQQGDDVKKEVKTEETTTTSKAQLPPPTQQQKQQAPTQQQQTKQTPESLANNAIRNALKQVFTLTSLNPDATPKYHLIEESRVVQHTATNIKLILDVCIQHKAYYKYIVYELGAYWKKLKQPQRITALAIIFAIITHKDLAIYRQRIEDKMIDLIKPLLDVTGRDVDKVVNCFLKPLKTHNLSGVFTPKGLIQLERLVNQQSNKKCELPQQYAEWYMAFDEEYFYDEFLPYFCTVSQKNELEESPPKKEDLPTLFHNIDLCKTIDTKFTFLPKDGIDGLLDVILPPTPASSAANKTIPVTTLAANTNDDAITHQAKRQKENDIKSTDAQTLVQLPPPTPSKGQQSNTPTNAMQDNVGVIMKHEPTGERNKLGFPTYPKPGNLPHWTARPQLSIQEQKSKEPQAGFAIPYDQQRALSILNHQIKVTISDDIAELCSQHPQPQIVGPFNSHMYHKQLCTLIDAHTIQNSMNSTLKYNSQLIAATNAGVNPILALSCTIWFSTGKITLHDELLRFVVFNFCNTDRVGVRKPPGQDLHFSFLRFETRYHACILIHKLKNLLIDVVFGNIIDPKTQTVIYANPFAAQLWAEYQQYACLYRYYTQGEKIENLDEQLVLALPWQKFGHSKSTEIEKNRFMPVSLNFASAGIDKTTFDQLLGYGFVLNPNAAEKAIVERVDDFVLLTESPFVIDRTAEAQANAVAGVGSNGEVTKVFLPPPSRKHGRDNGYGSMNHNPNMNMYGNNPMNNNFNNNNMNNRGGPHGMNMNNNGPHSMGSSRPGMMNMNNSGPNNNNNFNNYGPPNGMNPNMPPQQGPGGGWGMSGPMPQGPGAPGGWQQPQPQQQFGMMPPQQQQPNMMMQPNVQQQQQQAPWMRPTGAPGVNGGMPPLPILPQPVPTSLPTVTPPQQQLQQPSAWGQQYQQPQQQPVQPAVTPQQPTATTQPAVDPFAAAAAAAQQAAYATFQQQQQLQQQQQAAAAAAAVVPTVAPSTAPVATTTAAPAATTTTAAAATTTPGSSTSTGSYNEYFTWYMSIGWDAGCSSAAATAAVAAAAAGLDPTTAANAAANAQFAKQQQQPQAAVAATTTPAATTTATPQQQQTPLGATTSAGWGW